MRLDMQFLKVSSVLFLSLGLTVIAHAGVDGTSTNAANIQIGTVQAGSNLPGDHQGGTAALSVASAAAPYNGFLGFSALQGLAGAFTASGTSNINKTVSVTGADNLHLKVSAIPSSSMPGSHSALGNFNFAQVLQSSGTQGSLPATYFGEWWGSTDAVTGASHTVYYAGDNTARAVPTSGTAVYTVAGINNGANLAGKFNADFNAGTLNGTLTASAGTVKALDVNASISSSTGAFTGTATANNTQHGVTSGHFFGANADTLAGISQFADSKYDTAFGGVKN